MSLENMVNIKVIGVGGGGNNAIDYMIKQKVDKVSFIAINTDEQQLKNSLASEKILLKNADERSRGIGAGANPQVGEQLASDAKKEIRNKIKNSDLVIIAAGMGGGTGTGAAPIVASVAKDMGILSVGIVTTPFAYEGSKRFENSKIGIAKINESIDSLITISNEKLVERYGNNSLINSFAYADNTLKTLVETISNIINNSSLINVDFADVTTILRNQGTSMFGASKTFYDGHNNISEATLNAIAHPLSEHSIKTAQSALVWIKGSSSLTLDIADEIVRSVQMSSSEDMNIIFGVTIDDSVGDEVHISVIATGINPNLGFTGKTISFILKKFKKNNKKRMKRIKL